MRNFGKLWSARGTERDLALSEVRCVVCDNPFAKIPLPPEIFRGAYDERYGVSDDGYIGRLFAGEHIVRLETQDEAASLSRHGKDGESAMNEDEVIRRFLVKYNECQEFQYKITRRPDREERQARACDAYAEASGARPLAIEHTHIDSFDKKKLDDARFLRICGELERELKHAFEADVSLVIPSFAIQPGPDWNGVRLALREWLLKKVPNLPVGRSDHDIAGVPFKVTIWKHEGGAKLFMVSRWLPRDFDNSTELSRGIADALRDKNDQLKKYHEVGATTVLILQLEDVLSSFATVYKAFLRALTQLPAPQIDQVWMAHTSEPDEAAWIYCFLGPESIMDRANQPNFMFGPRYAEYWNKELEEEKVELV